MIEKRFYYEFENRHRGSREEIRKRLEIYNPVLALIERERLPLNAIDYGCGRGEWLRLLTERSWQPLGVDSNDDMLSPGQAEGLTVEVADCLGHIANQPDNSATLISGFHIVEHLPPDVLHDFVKHAYRVVRPSGLVIFETPNPENILVGSNRFYSDPTHIHPLPPKYLEFVVEFYGFDQPISVGVNQPKLRIDSGPAAAFLELMELFPDYAVLARKAKEGGSPSEFADVVRSIYPDNNPLCYRPIDKFIDEIHQSHAKLNDAFMRAERLGEELERLKAEIKFCRTGLDYSQQELGAIKRKLKSGWKTLWASLKMKI